MFLGIQWNDRGIWNLMYPKGLTDVANPENQGRSDLVVPMCSTCQFMIV